MSRLWLILALAGMMIAASIPTTLSIEPEQPAILEPVTREFGTTPVDALTADVVGNAQEDLVVTIGPPDSVPGLVLVFERLAGGGLAAVPMSHEVTGDSPGLEIATGDFDTDGDSDLIVTGEQDIQVFLQDSGGLGATASFSYPTSSNHWPASPVVADLNDDGRVDVAYVEIGAETPYTMSRRLQQAGGGLGADATLLSINDRSIVGGDVNNDGRDDLVVETGQPPITVLLQAADHTFAESSIQTESSFLLELLSGDVTGDGLIDLVVHAVLPESTISIFEGASGELPTQHASAVLPESTRGLAAADLNGDGTTDVITGGFHSGTYAVIQGTDGSLTTSCRYNLVGKVAGATDLTGTALPDIITTSQFLNGSVNVYPVEAPSSQMPSTISFGGATIAEVGDDLDLGGNVTFPIGGCVGPDASVEIVRTLPGGSPEVVATASVQPGLGMSWNYSTTVVAPPVEGVVEYSARLLSDVLHEGAESSPLLIEIHKRESVLALRALPDEIIFGKRATLRARLTGGSDRTVFFFAGKGAARVEIGRVEAAANGVAEMRVRPTEHTSYSAGYEGDEGYFPTTSVVRQVLVAAHVEGAMKRFSSKDGKYAVYRPSQRIFYVATVEPKKPGDKVRIYLDYSEGGDWLSAGSQAFRLGSGSSVAIFLRAKGLPTGTRFRFSTHWSRDLVNSEALSRHAYFKVLRAGRRSTGGAGLVASWPNRAVALRSS